MTVDRYRKKPVAIEAMQLTSENASEVAAWCGGDTWVDSMLYPADERPIHVMIRTLEGTMQADPGDFVIRGVQGEFYPCKPDIFAATYERDSGSNRAGDAR